MTQPLVDRALGGLKDLVHYEGGRLKAVNNTVDFIQNNTHHSMNLRTQEDELEFQVLMGSLLEACGRLTLQLGQEGRRCAMQTITTDQAVRACLKAGHRFSDDVEELSGMFLGLARRTKTIEARDFFIDVFRRLYDTADDGAS